MHSLVQRRYKRSRRKWTLPCGTLRSCLAPHDRETFCCILTQAAGSKIGIILQSAFSLGVSSVIALVLGWKMALVGMCAIPLVLTSAYIQCMIIMGQSVVELKSLDKANKVGKEDLRLDRGALRGLW